MIIFKNTTNQPVFRLTGRIFLGEANKVISECVDLALSRMGFVNKEAFYRTLEQSFGVKPQSIGDNFIAFHDALKARLGVDHYRFERYLIEILTQGDRNGRYRHSAEVAAFCIMTGVFMEESEQHIKTVKQLNSARKYAHRLEDKVKESEEKLKNSARMAAIGETAGMVGHDIRNPLQSIIGELYLLEDLQKKMRRGKGKEELKESIDSIGQSVDYINKIVSDLLDFARPLHPQYDSVDLSDLIKSVFKKIVIPGNITLQVEIEADPTLRTEPTFIRRALSNLVSNAIDAMPDGGKLTVATSIAKNSVFISVSDTGRGVPEEVKPNLFKPLFTTKSKGQGFGLAVTKRLIEQIDGKVTFESQKGIGTKFVLELPLHK